MPSTLPPGRSSAKTVGIMRCEGMRMQSAPTRLICATRDVWALNTIASPSAFDAGRVRCRVRARRFGVEHPVRLRPSSQMGKFCHLLLRIGGSKIQGAGEPHQIAQINCSTVTAPGICLEELLAWRAAAGANDQDRAREINGLTVLAGHPARTVSRVARRC